MCACMYVSHMDVSLYFPKPWEGEMKLLWLVGLLGMEWNSVSDSPLLCSLIL